MTAGESDRGYVLDTSAIIALMENEEGADRVEELLRTERVFVPFVVGLEAYSVTLQERSEDAAARRLSEIHQLPVAWLDQINDKLIAAAGKLKGRNRVSLADAIVAAYALTRGATLVHKDPEFEAIASQVTQERLPYKARRA